MLYNPNHLYLNKILKNAYKDEDSEFGNWLKIFFGLPFLHHSEVEDAFIQLVASYPNELYGHDLLIIF